jgi:NADH-quinone oxidoreductase subunit C
VAEIPEPLEPFAPRKEGNAIWVPVPLEEAPRIWQELRELGYDYLAAISGMDWLERGVIELVYHLWSLQGKSFVHLKVEVPRDQPRLPSAYPVWGGSAAVNEREVHEMFGVEFPGNPDLSPLFLEDWEGPPPFRKDFDWRAYVRERYYREDRGEDRGYYED